MRPQDHPGSPKVVRPLLGALVHPAYQQQTFELEGQLHVRQTIFVPKVAHAQDCAPAHPDRAVAYQRVEIANQGAERRSIRIYGFAQFRGDTEPDVQAHYDAAHGVLLAANAGQPNWVRVFGATMPVSAYDTSTNAYQVYPVLRMKPLRNHTEICGGALLSRRDGTGAAHQLRALRPGPQRSQHGAGPVQRVVRRRFAGEPGRGMRLSPWEAPRYLWAAVEGVCGVSLRPAPERPIIRPLLPTEWKWVGLRNLPYHGRQLSYVAVRMSPIGPDAPPSAGEKSSSYSLHLYATGALTSANGTPVEAYTSDVTDRVGVINEALRVVALERPGELVICVGNTALETTIGALELGRVLGKGGRFSVQLYDRELGGWVDLQVRDQAQLHRIALNIEAQGFRIVRLCEAKA